MRSIALALFLLLAVFGPATLDAQAKTVPALLLSDIHLDPFSDPAKVPRLLKTPAAQWDEVFSSPASPAREKDLAALQTACAQRGSDTSAELWRSSLQAIKAHASDVRFVTVSGDLLGHNFDCKFQHAVRGGTDAQRVAFIGQTVEYLALTLRAALPKIPVYIAMGNNDSGCGDYREDRQSAFLTQTAKIIAEGLPLAERPGAIRDFTNGGFYRASLPASIPNTRILVLDDLFLSSKYMSCSETPNRAATQAQMAWLEAQLAEAREQKQHVWVLGHIPPGVDLYATLTGFQNVCGRGKPVMFLGDERLAEVLGSYADVARLAIFGHSHTDELRLLTNEKNPAHPGPGVAVKIVTSISPINGNKPAFTIARVDPATADLVDYDVIASSNVTGANATWTKEYTFSEAYHKPRFTAATLKPLTDSFRLDPTGNTPESSAYLRNFYVGDRSVLIKPLWPEYVCALTHDSAQSFTNCVCKR